jgi:quaternary ammonium compound-resistance protein SugE
MELLFVILGGAILGLIAQYVLLSRELRGTLLLPALGAGVAAIVWASLTWVGLRFDGGWIWAISLVAAGGISVLVGVVASRRRRNSDAETLVRLGGRSAT